MANKYKCSVCKKMVNNSHSSKPAKTCGRCLRLKKKDVKMDKRRMKKEILYYVLRAYQTDERAHKYDLSLILDLDDKWPSDAMMKRFKETLRNMVDNARKKLE